MNLYRNYLAVRERRWTDVLTASMTSPEAAVRLMLLEADLKSLRIALEDYLLNQRQLTEMMNAMATEQGETDGQFLPERPASRIFHNAKVFIVCMRRFARLLEATKSRKHEYPLAVGRAIDLAWKQTRLFFEPYRVARDAIEHIDGELNGQNQKFINLSDNYLEVVDGIRAHVTLQALETVETVWTAIVDAVMRPADEQLRVHLMKRLVLVLEGRIVCLGGLESAPNKGMQASA